LGFDFLYSILGFSLQADPFGRSDFLRLNCSFDEPQVHLTAFSEQFHAKPFLAAPHDLASEFRIIGIQVRKRDGNNVSHRQGNLRLYEQTVTAIITEPAFVELIFRRKKNVP
jgi:hypothetical protein